MRRTTLFCVIIFFIGVSSIWGQLSHQQWGMNNRMLYKEILLTNMMAEKLDLSEAQQNKIQIILIEHFAKMDAIKQIEKPHQRGKKSHVDWDDFSEEDINVYFDNEKKEKIKHAKQMNALYKEISAVLTAKQSRMWVQLKTEHIEQTANRQRIYINAYFSVLIDEMNISKKDREKLTDITNKLLGEMISLHKERIIPLKDISDNIKKEKELYKNSMKQYAEFLDKKDIDKEGINILARHWISVHSRLRHQKDLFPHLFFYENIHQYIELMVMKEVDSAIEKVKKTFKNKQSNKGSRRY